MSLEEEIRQIHREMAEEAASLDSFPAKARAEVNAVWEALLAIAKRVDSN